MSKIKKLRDNLRRMPPEVMSRQALQVMQAHENIAVGMNTDELWEGKLANGDTLWDYSPISVTVYGKPYGPVRMFDEGDFYRGFFMNAASFPIIFGSKDTKTLTIMRMVDAHQQNPDELFGLTKTNFKELVRIYSLPDLQRWVREAIRVR